MAMRSHYSLATNQRRTNTAYFFFDLANAQDIPSAAEPFFLNLNAKITMAPAMNLEDMQAGVQKAMKDL